MKVLRFMAIPLIMTLISGSVVYIVTKQQNRIAAYGEKVRKYDEHCVFIKVDFERISKALLDARDQEVALVQFDVAPVYREVGMCATKPVDLSSHSACWISKDFKCLSDLAMQASLAIPRP